MVTLLGHFWTLSIEEQFYWVWPIVIWSLSGRAAMRLCAGLLVAASALRVYLVMHYPLVISPSFDVAFEYLFLPTRIDGLVVGSFVALALRAPGGVAHIVRWMRPAAIACVVVLVVLVAWRRTASHDDAWVIMIGYPALAVVFGGVVLYAAVRRSRVLELSGLRTLGKYSYGLYVLHVPIATVARLTFHVPDANVGAGRRFTAIVLPIVFAAAYLSYHVYEKQFLRLKDVLGPRPPRGPAGIDPVSATGAFGVAGRP
jgi:peptidoglycan/LPS O-acetylase OafA/YrhL